MLVSWNITGLCNLKCSHCYRNAGEKFPDELSFDEGTKLLKEIKKAGFQIVIFSGGEPLLRDDIFALIREANLLGLRAVCGTNGTLITREVAARLKESGTAAVGISLDSIVPEKHDLFRGLEGAWNRAVRGMESCREIGLPFQIHTTAFSWNYDEIEAITEFAVKMGAQAHHVFFFVPAGRGKGHKSSVSPALCEDLITRLLIRQNQIQIEIKPTCAPQFVRISKQKNIPTRFKRGCLAGISYCIIGPGGEVYPCPYMDYVVGNVRQHPFDEIWQNSEVFLKLRSQKYEGFCGICEYKSVCGGCRARAYEKDGNYMGEDPLCLYRNEQEEKLYTIAEYLLFRLQNGIPLNRRPFRTLAAELGADEKEILKIMRLLKAKGYIRRFGATFDSHKLSYHSTLCTARVPVERIGEVVEVVNSYKGVTHNYLREHEYNLWFTLIAKSNKEIDTILKEIKMRTGIDDILNLPSIEVFKVSVNFPLEELRQCFHLKK